MLLFVGAFTGAGLAGFGGGRLCDDGELAFFRSCLESDFFDVERIVFRVPSTGVPVEPGGTREVVPGDTPLEGVPGD